MSQIYPAFYFFSYGSNLFSDRIKDRVPSLVVVQNYRLSGYRLVFNKSSKDGSTKANIQKSDIPSDFVWGVIQRIDHTEKPALDRAEGLGAGYELNSFDSPTDTHKISYYIAKDDKYLKKGNPYDWYLDYVIMGAIENDLPRDYINQLLAIEITVDPNPESRNGYNDGVTKKIKAHKELNPKIWKG